MTVAAFVVSIFALLLSGVAVVYARLTARAADRQADEARRIATRTGRATVTVADLQTHSTVLGKRVLVARFGSWPAAVAATGLTIAPRGRYWTDEELRQTCSR